VREDLRIVYLVAYLGRGSGSWLGRSPRASSRRSASTS
jgi:hypothetical protein